MAITSTTAAVIGAVGAIASAGASIQQGMAAKGQADFQAAVQRQQAERARQIAQINEKDFRRDQSRLMAARRAAMGASGTEGGTGSALLTSEDLATEIELQAQRIRAGGEDRATRLDQQALLTSAAGRNARTSGFVNAGGSLLRGAGRVAAILREDTVVE